APFAALPELNDPEPDPVVAPRPERQPQAPRVLIPADAEPRPAGRAVGEPGGGGGQGRLGGDGLAEAVGEAVAVLHEDLHAEVDVALRAGLGARAQHLVDDLFRPPGGGARVADAAGVEAGPEVSLLRVLFAPPPQQHGVALLPLLDPPVE